MPWFFNTQTSYEDTPQNADMNASQRKEEERERLMKEKQEGGRKERKPKKRKQDSGRKEKEP
jgi:hypothetical protein